MKPNAAEAAEEGARSPDGMQAKPEKIKSLKNVKTDTGKPERLKYKPLTGKVFYLDIPSNVISEKIGKDLKDLGGISPVPSPESARNGGNSSAHPSNQKDRHDGSSFKIVDTVRMSRGKSLVEKAIKEQDLIPSGSILSNALSWGVKILHIDDVKNYIEQKKRELYLIKRGGSSVKDGGKEVTAQKSRSKLKNPFVKVEDRSRHYRPFYLQLPSFPVLNYCVPKPYSPFEVEKKYPSGQKQTQPKQRNKINMDKDGGTPVQLLQKDKKKRGYCECCGKKYEDLQTHLESEQHRNFAQSTQYQVVDDIISKFVYEFVEYKDDAKKIKRTKCSTGCFSPIIGKITRPDELKERLKKQRISLKSYSWKDTTVQALKLDLQPAEVQPNSVPIPTPVYGSVCSGLCHLSQPSELKSKFRNNDENLKTDCSCVANLRETLTSANFIQPPPQKDDTAYTENLSRPYQPSSKEILEPEVNEETLQCFQERTCTLYSHTQVTDLNEKYKNPSQPKRKLNNAVVLPAKCLKKTDANPTLVKKHRDLCDNHQQMQHSVLLEAEESDTAVNKELNELAASSAHGSPSGKLHRKVKVYLGRNKRETWKQSMELCVKYTDGLSVPEERRSSCSSPVRALLELFQTSEINSEFGGFSGSTENKCSTSIKDPWEGQNTNVMWSLFSSSSSSTFVGF
ncbi:protein DBF4 homolog A isoform X2 [Patagioenas fasciata]|uniref:protein DBF4 homolog A isoform X2 n=1 Tax=Patagioenas fasciata TaxID=372321 RepID=UPI0032E89F22